MVEKKHLYDFLYGVEILYGTLPFWHHDITYILM